MEWEVGVGVTHQHRHHSPQSGHNPLFRTPTTPSAPPCSTPSPRIAHQSTATKPTNIASPPCSIAFLPRFTNHAKATRDRERKFTVNRNSLGRNGEHERKVLSIATSRDVNWLRRWIVAGVVIRRRCKS